MLPYLVVVSTLLLLASTVLVLQQVRAGREIAKLPGAFRCRVRLVHGLLPGVSKQWRGNRRLWASWAHDVLVLGRGSLRSPMRILTVRFPEGSVAPLPDGEVRRLGEHPVFVRLRLDDGDLIEVAAPARVRDLLAGPFLVACLAQDGEKSDPRR